MKISEQSHRLVIQEKGLSLAFRFWFGCFILLIASGLGGGSLVMIYNSGNETLKCKPIKSNQINCELSETKWFGIEQGKKNVYIGIKEARVNIEISSGGEGGSSTDYIPVLTTHKTEVKLKGRDKNSAYRDVAQINNFLKEPTQTPLIIIKKNISFVGLGGFAFTFFLFVSFLTTVMFEKVFVLDKHKGTFLVRNQTWLGIKSHSYPLTQVQVHIRSFVGPSGDGADVNCYELSLVVSDNLEKIGISTEEIGSSTETTEAHLVAESICRFLNISPPLKYTSLIEGQGTNKKAKLQETTINILETSQTLVFASQIEHWIITVPRNCMWLYSLALISSGNIIVYLDFIAKTIVIAIVILYLLDQNSNEVKLYQYLNTSNSEVFQRQRQILIRVWNSLYNPQLPPTSDTDGNVKLIPCLMLAMYFVFWAFSLFVLWWTPWFPMFSKITYLFSKESDKFTISRCSIFGSTNIELLLCRIQDVIIEEKTTDDKKLYQVTLILDSQQQVPLSLLKSSSREQIKIFSQLIRSFLGLSLDR